MRASAELQALTGQAAEHLVALRALFAANTPPQVAALKQAVTATRTLRGNASVMGLDPFQAFLGRVFQ
jgi:hypothetical protein